MPNGRHRKVAFVLPKWVDALSPRDACLRSVAEDAYYAKALAESYDAPADPRCAGLLQAGTKSLAVMENRRVKQGTRCREGDRAARKFWEAKVCARK